jgi:hypothetical protein
MIPIGGDIQETEELQEPSRTYKLDLVNKRIVGTVDGLEAVKQAVYKILKTERFEYLIYDTDYGSEIGGLHGRSAGYVRSELQRRITEALLQDDRITAIEDMNISIRGDEAFVTFTVVSVYGNYNEEVKAVV